MELCINGVTQQISSASEVVARLSATANAVHREIWLTAPNGAALCALMNRDRGWLMFLREYGDAGFSSRNPSYDGSPGETIEYVLSNGEIDRHPAEWALTLFEVVRALKHFVDDETMPPFIHWHDDSK
jgi:hypothetical protein